jgi:hypothetical protein
MAIPPRTMSPSFRFKALNPAFQSDPRRILGQQLQQQGLSSAPVQTPLQGLGRLSSALVGAYLQKGAIDRQVARESDYQDKLTNALSGMNLSQTPFIQSISQFNPELALQLGGQAELKKLTTRPQTTFRNLSDAEAKAAGYKTDKGQKYQISSLGKVSQIGGGGINVNTGGKEGYKAVLDIAKKNSEFSTAARQSNSNIDQMLNLLTDEQIKTGTGQEFVTFLNKIGQILNPSFNQKDVAGVEAFRGFANQVILPKVKQLGSRPTDKDLEFVQGSFASLSNSVAGNMFLLKALKLSNARQILRSDAAIDFVTKNRGKINDDDLPFALFRHLEQVEANSPLYTQSSEALKQEFKAITGLDANQAQPSKSILDNLIKDATK